MIPERAEDHRQLARWPTDDPSQNRVGGLRRTLDRIRQALHQIEAHRYAAAGAVAGGGALAPHTWFVELHRQRAGSRHQHRQTSGGVGRVPEQRQCVRRFWLHQRRQEYRVLADAHTVAPQSREPRFTHMVQIFLRRIERKLEFAHLSARFGRTSFDPRGNLVLEDVRIYGSGIEDLAYRHAAVTKAAAFPVADERLGEKVCLALICAGTPPTGDEMLLHLDREGLSKFDMPEYFVVLPAFPLTPSGKILKRELIEWTKAGRIAPTPVRFKATSQEAR